MINKVFQLFGVGSNSLSEAELQEIFDRHSYSIYEAGCYYLASKEEGKILLERIFDRARKEMRRGNLEDEDFQISRIASDEINVRWKELGKLPDRSGLSTSPFHINQRRP